MADTEPPATPRLESNCPAHSLECGIIGNCTASALISSCGSVVWCCYPRFDGDPIFCGLLRDHPSPKSNEDALFDEARTKQVMPVDTHPELKKAPPGWGDWSVVVDDFSHSEQTYVRNTAILETVLFDKSGSALKIEDFCPRFRNHDRMFHPFSMLRRITLVHGTPRIRILIRPTFKYGEYIPASTHGSNHIRYIFDDNVLRITTDAPMTYILGETPFILNHKPIHFVMGPDESLGEHPRALYERFYRATASYWINYSRYLAIPPEFQQQVIRATITLKLCSLEDTGAIVAALTTSIPEYADSGRNWDYRYCWLRDAYHVVQVLNRLGTTTTMERYLDYLTNLIAQHNAEAPHGALMQPCYGIGLETDLTEVVCTTLSGYRGMGPVRVGNGAYTQRQNDVFGSVIMACAQYFFDERLETIGDIDLFKRLEPLGQRAYELANQPDAGIWELRAIAQVHTHSAVSCWVACDRLAKIAAHLQEADLQKLWRAKADEIHANVLDKAWNETRQCFVSAFGGDEVDAVLLLLPELGFIEYTDPRFLSTLKVIEEDLLVGRQVKRYNHKDDFGYQSNAFNVCTFWYIQALHEVGRTAEARSLFEEMLRLCNHVGIMSEDSDPKTNEPWGNFPQTYSMCGIINCALLLIARRWPLPQEYTDRSQRFSSPPQPVPSPQA
eukprot:CAMPEP_0177639700 /NCGR_PEP_ID=MMETSP0447-20121125/6158_1 /TAXON_ID=0 /ORGANISM="Stygamoeba regulata, Strain BSH-02190019" /LENGTH=669 /DNA_ID=CAMNT_0019141739 /DNA_START=29 /DNA_END=2038 /DNA_ORIENTATION=+